MVKRFKAIAKHLKQELAFYRMILADSRTPRIPKILLGLALAYALSPVDLVPDWIPVLGYLDDMVLVPALLILALKLIPEELKRTCRDKLNSKQV